MSCSRKKNSFPRFFVPWWMAVTRVGARDRDGSRGGGERRGSKPIPSFDPEKNSSRQKITRQKFSWFLPPKLLFNRHDYLSFVLNNHTVKRSFSREITVPRISANCAIGAEQLDSDIDAGKRTNVRRKMHELTLLCAIPLFYFFPPPFQENGRKFYNKIEATGS